MKELRSIVSKYKLAFYRRAHFTTPNGHSVRYRIKQLLRSDMCRFFQTQKHIFPVNFRDSVCNIGRKRSLTEASQLFSRQVLAMYEGQRLTLSSNHIYKVDFCATGRSQINMDRVGRIVDLSGSYFGNCDRRLINISDKEKKEKRRSLSKRIKANQKIGPNISDIRR